MIPPSREYRRTAVRAPGKLPAQLDAVAQKLLVAETITREEFEAIFPSPFGKKSGTPQVA